MWREPKGASRVTLGTPFVVTAADINANMLTYVAGGSVSTANFKFQVQDSGGTANGGLYIDQTERTLTLGDPYHCECQKTGRLLAEALKLEADILSQGFSLLTPLVFDDRSRLDPGHHERFGANL